MYFRSGYMPKAVIPGMLCPVLGWHCLAGAEGRAGLSVSDSLGHPGLHPSSQGNPGKSKRETASRQKRKPLGGFYSSSNLLWIVPGALIWPPTSHIFSCASLSPPGISMDDQEEVAQDAPAALWCLWPLWQPTLQNSISPFVLSCQNVRESRVELLLQPRYPGKCQQEPSAGFNTTVLSLETMSDNGINISMVCFQNFHFNKTTRSPEHKTTIFKTNRINEAE